mmetsp:Transcript_14951/g.33302  ORF Transcript_14951/g.33302 Transcript_14951/m.33302 type:complete len:320 (-) Transcript_14951:883-1842(-)
MSIVVRHTRIQHESRLQFGWIGPLSVVSLPLSRAPAIVGVASVPRRTGRIFLRHGKKGLVVDGRRVTQQRLLVHNEVSLDHAYGAVHHVLGQGALDQRLHDARLGPSVGVRLPVRGLLLRPRLPLLDRPGRPQPEGRPPPERRALWRLRLVRGVLGRIVVVQLEDGEAGVGGGRAALRPGLRGVFGVPSSAKVGQAQVAPSHLFVGDGFGPFDTFVEGVVGVGEDDDVDDGGDEHFDADQIVLYSLGDVLAGPVPAVGNEVHLVQYVYEDALPPGEKNEGFDAQELSDGIDGRQFVLGGQVENDEHVEGPALGEVDDED